MGVLGLTERQFFRLTLRQFWLLYRAHESKVRHTEWLTGLLLSTIVNHSWRAPAEPVEPEDFPLGTLRGAKKKRARINRKKIAAAVRANFDEAIRRQRRKRFQPPSR